MCFSCDDLQVNQVVTPNSNRIKLIQKEYIGGRTFYIIEIDKHLYTSCSDGGITHMESCPCKNKL